MPAHKGQKFTPSFRRIVRIEKAVRLELAGLRDEVIAEAVGVSVMALRAMRYTADYKAVAAQLAYGVVSEIHKGLASDTEYLNTKLTEAVPLALQTLVDAATQKNDKKLAVAASESILDRHGRFAKVSRTGIALPSQGGFISEKENATATALIAALQANQNIGQGSGGGDSSSVNVGEVEKKETVQ